MCSQSVKPCIIIIRRITNCTWNRVSTRFRSLATCTCSRWCSSDEPSYQGEFADRLIERARAGVAVHLLYDDVGCFWLPRRYKRRLRNHHAEHKNPLPAEDAQAYVLAPFDEDDEEAGTAAEAKVNGDAGPLVIAETTVAVRTMTVSMAVMQLDLAESPALLFRNAAHGGLNLVYRRPDGNVGWIDPERANGSSG